MYTPGCTVTGGRLAPSAPARPSSASRRAENHACQTPLQLSSQMSSDHWGLLAGSLRSRVSTAGTHVTVTFAAVGSVGSMGLMLPQGWLKHPDLWLTSVSLGPDGHGRRQQLPLQFPGWTRAVLALADQLWDHLLPCQQFRNLLLPCVKSHPAQQASVDSVMCNRTTKYQTIWRCLKIFFRVCHLAWSIVSAVSLPFKHFVCLFVCSHILTLFLHLHWWHPWKKFFHNRLMSALFSFSTVFT